MATFGWSYSNDFSGSKRSYQESRKVEQQQRNHAVSSLPLHPQSHSAETLSAGKKFRYDHRARLYVGNLSVDTNEVTLAEHFSTFGELIGVKIIKDHENGSSRGFGFVTFDCVENAEKAKTWFAYNYLKIDGREIKVKNAEKRIPFKDRDIPEKKAAQSLRNSPTLYWEYKWSDEINAEIYGPYETNLMLQWSKSGYFNSGCWVRQVDPQALHEENELETDVGQNKRVKLMLDYSDSSSESEDDCGNTRLDKSEEKRDDEDEVEDDFSDDKKSTDFVHVSEIDLSLFP